MILNGEFLRKLERLRIAFQRRVAATGEGSSATSHGGGMIEFKEHRTYSAGDDFRYIDWNVYSRLGELYVKEFSKEESIQAHIVVDLSASMKSSPEKWQQALQFAAGLGFICLASQNRVQYWPSCEAGVKDSPVYQSEAQIMSMFERLEHWQPSGVTCLAKTLQFLGGHLPKSSLVFVISDLLTPAEDKKVLQLLRGRRFSLAVVQILADEEWHPPYSGLVTVEDVETGEAVPCLFDDNMLTRYMEALNRLQKEWRVFCARHSIPFHVLQRKEAVLDSLVRFGLEGGFRT